MRRPQTLSTGLVVRQDFSDAVRAVFFQTEYDEFLYATHGGTLFIVSFQQRLYGLTCKHVFGDFSPGRLFITQDKQATKGSMPAPVEGLCYPSAPRDAAVNGDVVDLCAIRFADHIASDFFRDSPYIVDDRTVGTSATGHELIVAGVLKDKSRIIPPDITMGFCRLEFRDAGVSTFDPIMRQAEAQFINPGFDSVTGISGSPVFDRTANVLCGMVARGGMDGRGKCKIHYIDSFDILRFLKGIRTGAASTYYTKTLTIPVAVPR
jgi:hypothetical protein